MKILDEEYRDRWQERWNDLQARRFANDREVAELALELRKEFPEGDSGDAQFTVWVKANLRNGARPRALLARAQACKEFDKRAWERLGGWKGITFLMGLTLKSRYRLIDTLHGPGPFHYSTLYKRSIKLGISSKRKTRDSRSRSESRVDVLRRYIAKLHKEHPELPSLPEPVRKAMTPTILSALAVPGAFAS